MPSGCVSSLESALGALNGCRSLGLGVLLGLLPSISVLMVVDSLGSRWGDRLDWFGSCRGAKFAQTLVKITCLARHAEFIARC